MRYALSLALIGLAMWGCSSDPTVVPQTGAGGATAQGSGGYGGGSTTTWSGSGGEGGEATVGTGGMGTGGTPIMCDFTTEDTCENATVLSAVSGDDGGEASATGTTSAWFHVHIEETSSSVLDKDLQYEVTLESPEGMTYDLVVYEGPQDGEVDCEATPKPGTVNEGIASVSNKWDDDQGVSGEVDSLWLAIEVIYVEGDDCTTPWLLSVKGGPQMSAVAGSSDAKL